MSIDLEFIRQDLPEVQEFSQDSPENQELRRDSPENPEFSQDLPEIVQLPGIKIGCSSQSSSITCDDGKGVIMIKGDQEEEGEECRTPKSPRFMIPATLSCPPAPKKPAPSSKRKLIGGGSRLEFFEIVGRDEIDSFFRLVRARY